MIVSHGRERQMDHFVRQHPVIRKGLGRSIASHGDQDQSSIGGICHSMADARTASSANTQAQVSDRETAIVGRYDAGTVLDPIQKVGWGEGHRLTRQADLDVSSRHLYGPGL